MFVAALLFKSAVMVVFPNAKINLGLNIIKKRKDGYHDIASCFVPVPYYDVLEIIESRKSDFTSSGLSIPDKPEKNLCVKAYRMLKKDFGLPEVNIYLHKLIPVGGGLGGGSSDASYTLKCLNTLFELFLDDSILEDYAARLGSDCPFFIRNKPVMAYGTGNEFEGISLDLTGKYIVLVTPPVHVSTAEAYAGVTPVMPGSDLKEVLEQAPAAQWKELINNDFEGSVIQKYPQLARIKAELYEAGAFYASMSGSGSTLYGLFDVEPDINQLFDQSYQVRIFRL